MDETDRDTLMRVAAFEHVRRPSEVQMIRSSRGQIFKLDGPLAHDALAGRNETTFDVGAPSIMLWTCSDHNSSARRFSRSRSY